MVRVRGGGEVGGYLVIHTQSLAGARLDLNETHHWPHPGRHFTPQVGIN